MNEQMNSFSPFGSLFALTSLTSLIFRCHRLLVSLPWRTAALGPHSRLAELGSVMGEVGHGDVASTELITTCPLTTQIANNSYACSWPWAQSMEHPLRNPQGHEFFTLSLFCLLSSPGLPRFNWPHIPPPLNGVTSPFKGKTNIRGVWR